LNKIIEIIVAPNGQARVETKGFAGNDCRHASKFIEQAIGRQTNELLKSEFYQSTSSSQQVKEAQ